MCLKYVQILHLQIDSFIMLQVSFDGGEQMHKHLHKFETIMWLFIKAVLYILLLFIFMKVLGRENVGLVRLSRTMGITIMTSSLLNSVPLCVWEYDVGRRKSKPIINSLALAVSVRTLSLISRLYNAD